MNNVRRLWHALGVLAEAAEAFAAFVQDAVSRGRERLELPAPAVIEPDLGKLLEEESEADARLESDRRRGNGRALKQSVK